MVRPIIVPCPTPLSGPLFYGNSKPSPMSNTYYGRWIDESILLWSPGVPEPDNGVDETDFRVYFREIWKPEQLAEHLGVGLGDLTVGDIQNVRRPVWKGDDYLGMFVGSPRGPFHPNQAAIDLARSRLGQ